MILPIVTAAILLQILYAASAAVARLPGLGRAPTWVRATIALIGVVALLFGLMRLLIASLRNLVPSLPIYQANLEKLFNQWFAVDGVATGARSPQELMTSPSLAIDRGMEATTRALRDFADRFLTEFDIAGFAQGVLSYLTSFGGFVFITLLYAFFMLTEITGFRAKVKRAFAGDDGYSTDTMNMIARINHDIGSYLATKTLINVILGSVCWVILVALGVEYAVLWAIIIGVLNYIPYIGSFVGVAFPALFAVAQFGSLTVPLIATGLMTAAQVVIGNIVEPKLLSRTVNLSPMVVLIALSVWTAIWGIPGAILAVPFTTIMMIVLARREGTRPFAALLSSDGNV